MEAIVYILYTHLAMIVKGFPGCEFQSAHITNLILQNARKLKIAKVDA